MTLSTSTIGDSLCCAKVQLYELTFLLDKQLKQLGDNKLNILIDDSMKILNEYLRKQYGQKTERKIYNIKDLYNNSKQFNDEYPIVFSTTYSIKNV